MLRRIGAALVAVGLFLPYSPDVRVIASVWHNAAEVLFQGFPVLLAFVYVLHTFAPPLARFHQRHGQGLHGALRMVYFVLAGAYLATATAGRRRSLTSSRRCVRGRWPTAAGCSRRGMCWR